MSSEIKAHLTSLLTQRLLPKPTVSAEDADGVEFAKDLRGEGLIQAELLTHEFDLRERGRLHGAVGRGGPGRPVASAGADADPDLRLEHVPAARPPR